MCPINEKILQYLPPVENIENDPDDYFEEPYIEEMCDWCGVRPVTYRDEVYALCESCADQLFGD